MVSGIQKCLLHFGAVHCSTQTYCLATLGLSKQMAISHAQGISTFKSSKSPMHSGKQFVQD